MCALVTGVQTCSLPILRDLGVVGADVAFDEGFVVFEVAQGGRLGHGGASIGGLQAGPAMACVRTRTMGAPLSFCLRVWKRPGRVARFVPLRRRFVPMAARRSLPSVVARGGLGPARLRASRLRHTPPRLGLLLSPPPCTASTFSVWSDWYRFPHQHLLTSRVRPPLSPA